MLRSSILLCVASLCTAMLQAFVSSPMKIRTACIGTAVALVLSNEVCGLHIVAEDALKPALRSNASIWLLSDVCIIDKCTTLFSGPRRGDVVELRCACARSLVLFLVASMASALISSDTCNASSSADVVCLRIAVRNSGMATVDLPSLLQGVPRTSYNVALQLASCKLASCTISIHLSDPAATCRDPYASNGYLLRRLAALPGDLLPTAAPGPMRFVRSGQCSVARSHGHDHPSAPFIGKAIPAALVTGRAVAIVWPPWRAKLLPRLDA